MILYVCTYHKSNPVQAKQMQMALLKLDSSDLIVIAYQILSTYHNFSTQPIPCLTETLIDSIRSHFSARSTGICERSAERSEVTFSTAPKASISGTIYSRPRSAAVARISSGCWSVGVQLRWLDED